MNKDTEAWIHSKFKFARIMQWFIVIFPLLPTLAGRCVTRDEGFVVGGPGKDGIPSINSPEFNHISIADLSDSSVVLGVYLNGIARAYPTYILRWHEIVNDRFGNISVAITYSVLAGSSAGFYVTTEHESFGTSGQLYENNLVMYDRGSDNDWVQIPGLSTSCERLRRLPLMHTKWGTWKELHPTTELLSTRTGYDRDYSTDPYPQYARNGEIYFITSFRKGANPYDLHPKKSISFLLTTGTTEQYIFHSAVISETGSFAFKLYNSTSASSTHAQLQQYGAGGEDEWKYYSAQDALESFGITPVGTMEMKDYTVVVAYSPDHELQAAWLVATNVSMNGSDWEENFALINGTTLLNYLSVRPTLTWGFNDYMKEGVFDVFTNISSAFAEANTPPPGNTTHNNASALSVLNMTSSSSSALDAIDATNNLPSNNSCTMNCSAGTQPVHKVPIQFALYRLPLFRSYWFTASAIYPRAYILVQDGAQFRFESFDPDIIYQQPWRPWMVASIAVLSVLALVIVSCLMFFLYHFFNRKKFAKLNDADEFVNGSLKDEMKLLIEAGLIDPMQLQNGDNPATRRGVGGDGKREGSRRRSRRRGSSEKRNEGRGSF